MKTLLLPLLLLAVIFSACEKEDPVIPNEEELITTLIYRLEPLSAGGDVVELKFQDLDGDGGDAPIITTSPLKANTTYQGSITLLNELDTPPDNITEEVEEEGLEHQIFYVIDELKLGVEYMDSDLDGNPVGLITSLTTSDATSASLKIILRHEPKKPNDGTPEDAGGETDIEVAFDITIE